MPRPSASASRFAAHWVADALAADDALDFSAVMALLDVSPESLAGAPEAVAERVALRCLQELAAATAEGGVAAAPAPASAGMLRVDAARSCEDLLLEIIGEVGSSGSLKKDMLPAFSQDIQNIIRIKKPTLPEACFELLREVDPELACMDLPSPVEQNGDNKLDDQSLCNISHDPLILDKLRFPTNNATFRQENLANLVSETDTGNIQKDSIEPAPYLHRPYNSDSRCYEHPQEGAIVAVGVIARYPGSSHCDVEGNMSVADVPASASYNVALHESNTDFLSKQETVDHTAMVQPQSCGGKSQNPPHYNDGERSPDDGASYQLSKDPSNGGLSMQATIAPAFHRSDDALPTKASEGSHLAEFITARDTTMIRQVDNSRTHLSSPQHDSGKKVNQDRDCEKTSIQPVEKDSIHELTLRSASILPSESSNGTIQGDKSESNRLPGNTNEHTALLEQQNVGKPHLEVTCADKVNQALYSDGGILEKNMVCGGLNLQSASGPSSCKVALHKKISEANYLSEQNIEKYTTDAQKRSCSIIVAISPLDGDEKRGKQTSNKKTFGNTVVETSHVRSSDVWSGVANKMSFCIRDANGSLRGSSEQDLCIKCGKDGKLLKCSSCLLAAHNSCFGPSVTFEDSGQFHCPVCFYTKATEAYQNAKKTYCEARKNLTAFLGTKQLVKQHDEQPPGVLPSASHSDDLNGYNSLKRKTGDQRDEEPDRQRKKQKRNASSDACCEEVVTEKAPSVRDATSDVELMNKHSVLQNNSKVQDSEKEQQVENTEAHENSHNETRNSSHNKHGPSATNQEVDADKEGGLTNSNQPEDSEEMEATSSYDSGKRSLPPFHNIRHRKAGVQERETPILSNSRKTLVQQDQHMPSPSRKRNYAYPTNSRSGPVAPTGRRLKLCWTEEEETALKEAMAKFTPRDNGPFPWVQILEHGKDVFHNARLPCDLRVKWRNMMKKAGS